MGQFLLCAGAKGKRFSLPHSRILMHQPSGQAQGQAADIAIQAEQIVYLKRMMAERIAFHTGQPVERIEADSDRDRWFTAEEAKDYGFIDQVIERAADVTEPTPLDRRRDDTGPGVGAFSSSRNDRERVCGREDSNLHPSRDQDLNLARLPVSPRPHDLLTSTFILAGAPPQGRSLEPICKPFANHLST